MTLKVVEFQKKDVVPEPPIGKDQMIEYLEELLQDVRENKVKAMICVQSFATEEGVTQGFRAGDQDMSLVGRLEYMKHRLLREIAKSDDV